MPTRCSIFSLIEATFWSLHFTLTSRKGVDTKKPRAHKTFEPVQIIWYAEATCYLIYSQIEATFRFTLTKTKKSPDELQMTRKPIAVLMWVKKF